MSWSYLAPAHANRWLTTPWFDLVDGAHDGYHRLSDPVTHRRIIIFVNPDTWIVHDLVAGSASHELESWFHVAPDCTIDSHASDGTAVILRSPAGAMLQVQSLDAGCGATAFEVVRGGRDDAKECWFSPGYGTKGAGQALRQCRSFSGAASLLTSFSNSLDTALDVSANDSYLRIATSGTDEPTFWLIYRIGMDSVFEERKRTFDGEMLFLHRGRGTAPTVRATHFTRLAIDDILEIRSALAIDELKLDGTRVRLTMDEGAASQLRITVRLGLSILVNDRPRPGSPAPR
jgi:hypothetical protein